MGLLDDPVDLLWIRIGIECHVQKECSLHAQTAAGYSPDQMGLPPLGPQGAWPFSQLEHACSWSQIVPFY